MLEFESFIALFPIRNGKIRTTRTFVLIRVSYALSIEIDNAAKTN